MKAVLFERGPAFRLAELPDPVAGPGEVLIRVGACGICASDLHLAEINAGVFDLPYPFVAGHELAGEIVAVGPGVRDLQAGQRVVANPLIPCGICPMCRRGHINLCRQPQALGLQRPGGFAEYVVAPAANALPVGDLSDTIAALTEPLACALHGLERLVPQAGDRVLLFGAGAIGLLLLQRIRGIAGHVTVVDLHTRRLELARQLGADAVLATADASVSALTAVAPASFDCVVDATGVPAVVERACEQVGPAGKLLLLGSGPAGATITVRPRLIQRWDKALVGSFGFGFQFAPALRLLQEGRIRTDLLLGEPYALEEYEQAFRAARAGEGAIKVQFASLQRAIWKPCG